MIVTVNSQTLAAELRLLNKIVPNKPAIAILSHALLTADDALHFWATDLEVGLSTRCGAEVSQPGVVALPVATFLSLVEQFPSADVIIASEGRHVSVMCCAFKSKLQTLPADDFPTQPAKDGTSFMLDAAGLGQMITRTRYAISEVSSKVILNGALLTMVGPAAAMVTTDGKRLALSTMSRTGADTRVIIPAKALDALTGQRDEVELTIGRHLHFAFGDRMLISRMIDGEFPQYERIIPRGNERVVVLDRMALAAALRRVVLVSDNKATYFHFTGTTLELSSRSAEIGSAVEELPATCDGDLKICVNGSYVLDFLNAASGSQVTMKLKDEKSAMLMLDGADHLGVLMLMKG